MKTYCRLDALVAASTFSCARLSFYQPVPMTSALTFTGERFLPDQAGDIWNEHWHRYHFVMPAINNKTVLDVACGEGYGSALMARAAAAVTGVDIAVEAINHAKAEYTQHTNLEFICASCDALPFGDAQFDVVVSFETIEHIATQKAFLAEVKRVLKPDGVLLLSSPNKAEYSDARGYKNEFHVSELYAEELASLLASYFTHARWWSQRNSFYSLIEPLGKAAGDLHAIVASKKKPQDPQPPLPALYFIIAAGNNDSVLTRLALGASTFIDAEEFALNDYRKIYRELVKLSALYQDLLTSHEKLRAERDQLLRERPVP